MSAAVESRSSSGFRVITEDAAQETHAARMVRYIKDDSTVHARLSETFGERALCRDAIARIRVRNDKNEKRRRDLERELATAEADAERHARFEIPSPKECARYLPLLAASALLRCQFDRQGWKTVSEVDAALLRPHGLCEARGPYLGAYGMMVRKILADWDGAL